MIKHIQTNNMSPKKSKKHKKKKSKSSTSKDGVILDTADTDSINVSIEKDISDKTRKSKKKKEKKKKRKHNTISNTDDVCNGGADTKSKKRKHNDDTPKQQHFPFEYQHIVAPMVGASELAFRLLCRKYGATLAYTPMMSSSQFIKEAAEKQINITNCTTAENTNTIANSNICEFQTIPQDRPLVVHFSSNNPNDFATASKLVEKHCDAIDLNLGCPQRTAYLGHFGSYLLGNEDRQLIVDIVKAGSQAVSIPIFVKIRLLDTIEETIQLCHQLRDAGASLIAIHARYRASWERTSAGARDGPAMLDQVLKVKESMPDFPIISNGNVITYDDVVKNKQLTNADGIMSAEGILNNPALYLPRLGDVQEDGECEISIPIPSPLHPSNHKSSSEPDKKKGKAIRKLQKKLREIESIERKVEELGEQSINDDQRSKLSAKSKLQTELKKLEDISSQPSNNTAKPSDITQTKSIKLSDLYKVANNKLVLAREYISLVRSYPMKIRSVVFHTRRMCKDILDKYQLMEECIASTTIDQVEAVIAKCEGYMNNPESFQFDQAKAAREKDALKRKREEEGKRKRYEGRMTRKAKREGLDPEHYLRMGAEVPSVEIIKQLKKLPKDERLEIWKKNHSQHCLSYHLEEGGCKRDRSCAFLHSEAKDVNKFDAADEVAG